MKLELIKVKNKYKFKFSKFKKGLSQIYTLDMKNLTTKPDPLVVRQVLETFPDIEIDPLILKAYNNHNELIKDLQYPDSLHENTKIPLTDKQKHAVHFMSNTKSCILADDMGLGKTLSCLAFVEQEKYRRVLVVSPAAVKSNWHSEVEKWGIKGGCTVCDGDYSQRHNLLVLSSAAGEKFTIINYEMLDPKKYPEIFQHSWDCIIFDEAHYLKTRVQKDKRTKQIKAGKRHLYAKQLKATKKISVTGTPFTNDAGEVWTMLNLIDSKRFSSYWEFVNYFCNVEETYFGTSIKGVNLEHEDDLKYILSRYMIRREKDIRSKKIFHRYDLEFGADQKIAYKTLENDFVYGDKIAESSIEKFTRLLQLSVDPKIHGLVTGSIVNQKILDLVSEIEDQHIIIGTTYKDHVKLLSHYLNGYYGDQLIFEVTGQTKNKKQIVDGFRDCGGILICTIQSIAEGLSIDECNHMILADLTFSPTKNWQFFNRIHRMTSIKDKHYHVLVTEGVNTLKHVALTMKQDMIDGLMTESAIMKWVMKNVNCN